jgi:RNA polymerase sigma-70 factor (ECF subfamily)
MTDSSTAACAQLYTAYHGWLEGWLRQRLACHETAADLAQDTFLRVLAKRRPVAGLRRPRAYLATIAHGMVVNHWRRQEIERAYLEALTQRPQAWAPSPEERELIVAALTGPAAERGLCGVE